MVAVTVLLSKYTILYGKIMSLVVNLQMVARRWRLSPDILVQYIVIPNVFVRVP